MRFVGIALLAGVLLAPPAGAQKLDLKFDAIAARASEKAEVDLDSAMLKMAARFGLSKTDKDDKSPLGDLLGGVQEVHLRHYEFDKDGAWAAADLEPLRKQVSEAAGWSRIFNATKKEENAEVFLRNQAGKVSGCLILAVEPRELTVVYILGTLTVAQVRELVDSNAIGDLAAIGH